MSQLGPGSDLIKSVSLDRVQVSLDWVLAMSQQYLSGVLTKS